MKKFRAQSSELRAQSSEFRAPLYWVFTIIACLNQNYSCSMVPDTHINSVKTNTPYAAVELLDSLTNDNKSCVFWRVARSFALIELEAFRSELNWQSAELSDRPVLIYDRRGFPRFYEFRVIINDKETGTVTCNAQKSGGEPVAFILPHKPTYNIIGKQRVGPSRTLQTESIFSNETQEVIIDMGYPQTTVGRFGNLQEKSQGVCADGIGSEYFDPLDYALQHPEQFTNSHITISMVIKSIQAYILTNNLRWAEIASNQFFLIDFSTNEAAYRENGENNQGTATVGPQISGGKSFDGGTIVNRFNLIEDGGWWDPTFVTDEKGLNWFQSPYLEYGRWCGPMVVGLACQYYYFTNLVKYTAEYDGYYELCTRMGIDDFTHGSADFNDVKTGIEWASSGKVLAKIYDPWWDSVTSAWNESSLQQAQYAINRNDLFMLRRNKFSFESGGHWRLGIGYKHVYKKTLLFYRWPNWKWFPVYSVEDSWWYLLTDNGYEASTTDLINRTDRRYITEINTTYSENIFWENRQTTCGTLDDKMLVLYNE